MADELFQDLNLKQLRGTSFIVDWRFSAEREDPVWGVFSRAEIKPHRKEFPLKSIERLGHHISILNIHVSKYARQFEEVDWEVPVDFVLSSELVDKLASAEI
jgi:hypothetical protein